ncbi:MAG: flavodoxin [Deltaproteobacteria bacterium]|nr:MAG: flavodoxin [Deltaproteobacteria bacterium]
MSKALIVYGSTTGNTEAVAEQISGILEEKGIEVTLKNVTDATVDELGGDYDLTLLGSSTWGDDEIEFQEDFEPFFEELGNANLKDKKVAVFGCGDSSYEFFCGAVDKLDEKLTDMGAKQVNEGLRIDGDPSEASSEIDGWAADVAASI